MLFGTPENRPTWIETRHLKMQKFKRGKTQVKLSKTQQTLPFWLLTGIKINKIHKVLYAFFEITFLPKSDRFRRPNIWLETNFCDVAQTLEMHWFRLKFALFENCLLFLRKCIDLSMFSAISTHKWTRTKKACGKPKKPKKPKVLTNLQGGIN